MRGDRDPGTHRRRRTAPLEQLQGEQVPDLGHHELRELRFRHRLGNRLTRLQRCDACHCSWNASAPDPAPTPEPSAVLLIASGVTMIGLRAIMR